MQRERILSLLTEQRSYLPPIHNKSAAWVRSMEEYEALCNKAREDPEGFWGARAQQLLHWFRPWNEILHTGPEPYRNRWYVGGRLNACYNCVDRHIINGRRNKAALIWQGEREQEVRCYTYQMLYTEVSRIASALSSMRVRKGDRVALYMPMIPELVIAMLACARIGAIHTVIFSGYAEGGVRSRIQDAKAKVVITADAVMRMGKAKPLKAQLDPILEKCPSVAHVIVVNRAGIDVKMERRRDVWWHEMLEDFTLEVDFPCESMEANDTLFLLHTSGSTGKPTGVMHSTGGYLTYTAHTSQWVFDMRDDDVYWCTADVGWITGHSYMVYGPLALGATTVMFEGVPNWPRPDRYWNIVEKFQVNILYTAPTVIRSLMQHSPAWAERYDLSSLRLLGSVGEPISPETWMWYRQHIGHDELPVVDTWWQTETGGIMISPLPYATRLKPGSATLPLPGIDAAILSGDGSEDTDGGHLVIRKPWPGFMQGVYGNPEKFRSYFERFGVYQSGDGATVDEDGYFWILGRMDDAINVSGHRLSTAEIEAVLVSHEKVTEAAVVPMPHELKGEGIYAFVILAEDVPWSEDLRKDLLDKIRKDIGPLATPEVIQFSSALPKTCSGKILRRMLRKIAAGVFEDLGDASTLAHPEVLDDLIASRKSLLEGRSEI